MILADFPMLGAMGRSGSLMGSTVCHVHNMTFKCYYTFTKNFQISSILVREIINCPGFSSETNLELTVVRFAHAHMCDGDQQGPVRVQSNALQIWERLCQYHFS